MKTDITSRNTPDRMDLPFVGLTTFARHPPCLGWDRLDGADVAVVGVPIDTASSYRVGTRYPGPACGQWRQGRSRYGTGVAKALGVKLRPQTIAAE